MDTVQSLAKYIQGLMCIYVVLTFCNYNAISGQPQDQQSEQIVFEKAKVTLNCNHKSKASSLQAIVWVSEPGENTIAKIEDGKHNILLERLQERGIISPEGDLIITNVNREDAGLYNCYTIEGGVRVSNKDGLKKLIVHVKPENHQILCSGQTYGTPNENCKHIKKDAIMSIQCQFDSFPRGIISWSELPMGCKQHKTESTSGQIGNLFQESYVYHNVCEGQYCCVASYEQDNTQVYKQCVTVGHPSLKPPDPMPLEKPENDIIFIIVIMCVTAIILAGIIIIVILCYCNYGQLRNDCPCLCGCCPANIEPIYKPTNEILKEVEDSPEDMLDRDVYSSQEDIDPKRYDEPEPPPYSFSPPFTPVTEDEDTVDGPSLPQSANPPAYAANLEQIDPDCFLDPENQDHEVLRCAKTLLLSSAYNTQDSSKLDNLENSGTSSLFARENRPDWRASEPLPQTTNMFEKPEYRRCLSTNSANKKPVKISIYRKRSSTLM